MDNNNQRVECIVSYEYAAVEPDELSICPGDVIRDVERLSGGWWRGELRGHRGMFPDNFVTVKTGDEDAPVLRNHGPTGRCKAIFSYQAANPDELSLSAGDTLDVLGEVEEGWWQGKAKNGKIGVFPSNFVMVIDPQKSARPMSEMEAPLLPPKPVREQCRVLFPYMAVNEDELTLSEGDIVAIVSRDGPDRGWWKGELKGKVGLFPDNFVVVISPNNPANDFVERKPERPPNKTALPTLKCSEKIGSVKEQITSKIGPPKDNSSNADHTILQKDASLHKEMTTTKEKIASDKENFFRKDSSASTVSSKTETEKTVVHTIAASVRTVELSSSQDTQVKKPPVPVKKSPTPVSTVSNLFSGLKNKMLSSDHKEKDREKEREKSRTPEPDRIDGIASSRLSASPATPPLPSTQPPAPADRNVDGFDQIERNSILNDMRAGRPKAPRKRPPSAFMSDSTTVISSVVNGVHNGTGEPVLLEEPKLEEMKPKTREWEKHKAPWMEELKLNQAKKTTSIADIGKSKSVSSHEVTHLHTSKVSSGSTDKILEVGVEERKRESTHSMEMSKSMSSITNRMSKLETFDEVQTRKTESIESSKKTSLVEPASNEVKSPTAAGRTFSTIMMDDRSVTSTSNSSEQQTIAQLNNRIINLENELVSQVAKFSAIVEDLSSRLDQEIQKRLALQSEVEKLAQCVTQV